MEKKYYKYLDIIKIVACIFILLYHLGILKGGYLAVCSFFTISGYLSYISAYKYEKFSLKKYYLNRLIKIYIPLLLVVFITIAIISFTNTIWLNLNPEATSILLGYNNFWQISANLDYFAHQISSPFMHLWFLSIILQFELLFPFVYMILKKIENKLSKEAPILIVSTLSIVSITYFYLFYLNNEFMITYYSTLTRSFSLWLGVLLGFIHTHYGTFVPNKFLQKTSFYFYVIILCILFCIIDANGILYQPCMVLTTFITLLLISYGVILNGKESNLIKYISSITYEIYLIQYPVIFIFQSVNINQFIKIPLMFIIIIAISVLMHSLLGHNIKRKVIKILLLDIVVTLVLYGVIKYINSYNYTKEINNLKSEISQNEKLMKEHLKEYENELKKEQNDYQEALKEVNIDNLEAYIKNLHIVGVGDSVMLGAVLNLYKEFKNGYFDAKISRTAWVVGGVLDNLKKNNLLGNPIILNLGANGDCSSECKQNIMKICEDREVFWINVTNDSEVHINKNLDKEAEKYKNLHIIDWETISKGHKEYFYSDGIHLTDKGKKAYVQAIYDNLYEFYFKLYKEKRENIINEHNEKLKKKISFYGNELLINAYSYISPNFKGSSFITKKEYSYDLLKDDIEKSKKEQTLSSNIVLLFDKSMNLNKSELDEIIKLCNDSKIYILSLDIKVSKYISTLKNDNIVLIDFEKEIGKNYLMFDKVHLTNDGNKVLSEILIKYLK